MANMDMGLQPRGANASSLAAQRSKGVPKAFRGTQQSQRLSRVEHLFVPKPFQRHSERQAHRGAIALPSSCRVTPKTSRPLGRGGQLRTVSVIGPPAPALAFVWPAVACAVAASAPWLTRELVTSLPDQLRAAELVFQPTGGLHTAALFDRSGARVALREDVSRHNAVDTLVGWAFPQGRLPLADHGDREA